MSRLTDARRELRGITDRLREMPQDVSLSYRRDALADEIADLEDALDTETAERIRDNDRREARLHKNAE